MKRDHNRYLSIAKALKKLYDPLFTITLENLEETGEFLEAYKIPKLNQEKVKNLDRSIISKETRTIIQILPKNKSSDLSGVTINFY